MRSNESSGVLDLDGASMSSHKCSTAASVASACARRHNALPARSRGTGRAPVRGRTPRCAIRRARCRARAAGRRTGRAQRRCVRRAARGRARPARSACGCVRRTRRDRRCAIAVSPSRARTPRVREVRVIGVARQHDAGRVIHLRDDEAALARTRRPQTPLDVAEHTDAPRRRLSIGQGQHAPASRDPRAPRRPPVPARMPATAC